MDVQDISLIVIKLMKFIYVFEAFSGAIFGLVNDLKWVS